MRYQKEDEKCNQIKDCWFEFQGCISEASGNQDHIEFLHESLKVIRSKIKQSSKKGST